MKNQCDLDKTLDKLIDKAEEEVHRIYAKRMKYILHEIQKMYEKYEKDGVLTLADMTKYNRLDKSLDSILRELLRAQNEAYALAQQTMTNQYLYNYFATAYLAEFEAQRNMGFGQISKEVVEAAIRNPIDQLTLPKLQEKNRADIVRKVKTEIQQGLIAGESYGKMVRRVRDAVDWDKSKAQTVVITEGHRTQVQGRLDSMDKVSKHVTTGKVWSSTLDTDTRRSHQRLDDQEADEEGYFHFGTMKAKGPGLWVGTYKKWNAANMNIRCRCAFMVTINGERPEVRRERLEESKVVPYLSYVEWAKTKGLPTFEEE